MLKQNRLRAAHVRGAGTRRSLRSLPSQTSLWLCERWARHCLSATDVTDAHLGHPHYTQSFSTLPQAVGWLFSQEGLRTLVLCHRRDRVLPPIPLSSLGVVRVKPKLVWMLAKLFFLSPIALHLPILNYIAQVSRFLRNSQCTVSDKWAPVVPTVTSSLPTHSMFNTCYGFEPSSNTSSASSYWGKASSLCTRPCILFSTSNFSHLAPSQSLNRPNSTLTL